MPADVSTWGAKTTSGRTRADGLDDLLDRGRGPRRLLLVGDRPRAGPRWSPAMEPGVEDLRPAEGEEPVADDEAPPAGGQLPRDGLHGVGATARDHGDRPGVIRRGQDLDDLLHDVDEALRHVVERAVGEDDRVLQQAIGIDVSARQFHVGQTATRDRPGADSSVPARRRRAAAGRPAVRRQRDDPAARRARRLRDRRRAGAQRRRRRAGRRLEEVLLDGRSIAEVAQDVRRRTPGRSADVQKEHTDSGRLAS